ncbi:fungal ATP synthase protein 8-domain-containing protein [Phyllosticta capitalensis]|uniref:ATP synthase protein 8 n=1 Tax=Phyllosticta capitalensis TaxID=121624 RepID=A0ABR1Z1C9_9PEZI
MSASRFFRPLTRAVQRQAFAAAAPASARTGLRVAPFTPNMQQQPVIERSVAEKAQTVLYMGMPQLVPFYWVNEATFGFIILPSLIYVFSKYLLPQNVRRMCARLFISKL